jgi:predicted RND superfamily exporter protein
LGEIPAVGGTLAATTFVATIPTGRGVRDTARRGVIARRILANRQRLVDMQYLYLEVDADRPEHVREEQWRISGRVEALSGLEYASFLDRLEREVDEFLQADDAARRLRVKPEVSGGVFLVSMAQKQLMIDLQNSFLLAFLLIVVAMMVLTRNPVAGLISMVPNVFPALLIFGVIGWLDVAVDIGTMMTASVAMGIAVDDTSHFLTWFRRGVDQGMTRTEAIRHAFHHCATPMLQTSLICGLGMLVFVVSPFTPVARFACLMFVLLFAALVGDVILLPAILASPAGRLVVSLRRK